MKTSFRLVIVLILLCMSHAVCVAQSKLLDNASHRALDLRVNDVVYDHVRNVLYASVPSTGPAPLANTITTIDPATGNILDSIFVGESPNTLAISDDASRVYVGIDGSRAMRWWQPANDQLGELRPLVPRFGGQGVAHDMAVPPGRPNIVAVSVDEVGNTGNGDMAVFSDTSSMLFQGSIIESPNYIGFRNATYMVGFDDSNTGFRAQTWQLNDLALTVLDSQNEVVDSFDIEAELGSDGLLYFTDGTVVDPTTLTPVSPYTIGLVQGRALVQPVPALDLTYFVGTASNATILKVFDSQTQLEIDSIALPVAVSTAQDRGELIIAGKNRLAFVWKPQTFDGPGGSGFLHIVSGIPVELVPEPSSLAFVAAGLIGLAFSRQRRLPVSCQSADSAAV